MALTRRGMIGGTGALVLTAGALGPRSARAQQQLTADAVLNDPDAPVLGNPDGDVTIVEYFDYQCGYCKSMHPVLMDVVARDGNIRLVMKDWPVFGPTSVRAAQMALGAVALDAYQPVVDALMTFRGRLTEAMVDRTVDTIVPADRAWASYEAGRDTWDGLLRRNAFQAKRLGFRGTPSFAVETVLYGGAMERDQLISAIATARAG